MSASMDNTVSISFKMTSKVHSACHDWAPVDKMLREYRAACRLCTALACQQCVLHAFSVKAGQRGCAACPRQTTGSQATEGEGIAHASDTNMQALEWRLYLVSLSLPVDLACKSEFLPLLLRNASACLKQSVATDDMVGPHSDNAYAAISCTAMRRCTPRSFTPISHFRR